MNNLTYDFIFICSSHWHPRRHFWDPGRPGLWSPQWNSQWKVQTPESGPARVPEMPPGIGNYENASHIYTWPHFFYQPERKSQSKQANKINNKSHVDFTTMAVIGRWPFILPLCPICLFLTLAIHTISRCLSFPTLWCFNLHTYTKFLQFLPIHG